MTDNANLSIIDKGMTIEGTIKCDGCLIIRGIMQGSLNAGDVEIGEEGSLLAETKARSLVVGGTYKGKVQTSGELVVLRTGICEGELVCHNLVIFIDNTVGYTYLVW